MSGAAKSGTAMKFFKGVRCSAYLQGARMRQDKKTSVRYWNVTLAITMTSKLAHACSEMIVSNYAQIATEENRCGGIDLDEDPPAQRVTWFKLEDAKDAALSLGKWTVAGLRLTKVEGLVELWATLEHIKTDELHRFVGEYAFTRMWAEFVPNAEAPEPAKVDEPKGDAPVESIGSLVMDAVMDAAEGKGSPEVRKALKGLGAHGPVTLSRGDRVVTIGATRKGSRLGKPKGEA